jgi:predicted DNA-binding transcriptional regulator AlpA
MAQRTPTIPLPRRPERLWTVDDLSDFLGVPVGTLYQWRSRGQGPRGYRIGRHLRYDPVDVRAWLAKVGH